jgi:hypothetical protein
MTDKFSEAKRLHHKGEPLMPPGHLYSMLDIMGGTVTCDRCGNWQRLPVLSPADAPSAMTELGWKQEAGQDLCPKCKPLAPGEQRE